MLVRGLKVRSACPWATGELGASEEEGEEGRRVRAIVQIAGSIKLERVLAGNMNSQAAFPEVGAQIEGRRVN